MSRRKGNDRPAMPQNGSGGDRDDRTDPRRLEAGEGLAALWAFVITKAMIAIGIGAMANLFSHLNAVAAQVAVMAGHRECV
jgi:hypothetical protein